MADGSEGGHQREGTLPRQLHASHLKRQTGEQLGQQRTISNFRSTIKIFTNGGPNPNTNFWPNFLCERCFCFCPINKFLFCEMYSLTGNPFIAIVRQGSASNHKIVIVNTKKNEHTDEKREREYFENVSNIIFQF